MLVNLTVYFYAETPVSILTTDQAVLDAVHQTRTLNFFMVAGVRGDCLVVPKHNILSMAYTQAPIEKYADKQREGEGEKSVEPSEE